MKVTRKLLVVSVTAGVAAGGMSALAQQQPPSASQSSAAAKAADPNAIHSPVFVEQLTVTGTVTAVDPAKRTVSVASAAGPITLTAGPKVENFNKIRQGDQVTIRYTEATALALAKGGTGDDSQIRSRVEADAARQLPPANRPGLAAMERVTVTANVFDIDREKGILTLRGTSGTPVAIKVQDKNALANINRNDQVVISYVERAAVAIEPRG